MSKSLFRAAVFVLIAFAVAAPAFAGVRATIILTSGERVKGVLVDFNSSGFIMNEGGAEVTLSPNDIAVLDFAGGGQNIPVAETSKIQPGRMLFIQRNGDYFYGRLIDMGGGTPARLEIRTQDGPLESNTNDVVRVYFRAFEGMPKAR